MTRRLFGTLLGLVFLINFGRVMFAPLLVPMQEAFGVGPAAVGVVTSLVWVGSALPRIPVGYLLTRVPRHRVVLATGSLLTVAAAFTASAPSLAILRVGAFLIGLASGAYFVAAVPLIGELYPDAIGRALGIHGTAAQSAAVIVPSLAVAVLAVSSWRGAFWLLAAGTAVLTFGLLAVVRLEGVPDGVGADQDFLGALGHWRVIVAGVAMVAVAGFVWQGVFNFYVSYLMAVKGLTQGTAGTLLTVTFGAGVPAFSVSGRLVDRFPHVPYVLSVVAAFAVSVFALTAVTSLAGLVLVSAAIGYTIHSLFPAIDTYMLAALPSANRASAYAVFSGVALLLEAGGSGAVGFLTEAGYGFDVVFRGMGAAALAALAVLSVLYVLGRLPGGNRSASRPASET